MCDGLRMTQWDPGCMTWKAHTTIGESVALSCWGVDPGRLAEMYHSRDALLWP